MSINGGFNARSNALNALRLVLAALVVVSHSWQLGGYGPQPQFGNITLGTWAVCGFFSISGYLITRSRLSGRPAIDFYWARFLRIYPAFFICLLFVAFIAAPVSTLIGSGHFGLVDSVGYVYHNLFLYPPVFGQQGIGDTLAAVPFANTWNGPLWTLFYEAACYVLIGVLVTVIPRRYFSASILVLFLAVTVVASMAYARVIPVNEIFITGLPLLAAFLAGAVLLLFGDYISSGWIATAIAIVLLAGIVVTGFSATLAPFPLAFLLIKLGSVLPLQQVGAKYDVSYGVYIYGCIVQQFLALLFAPAGIPVWAFVALSLAGTWPLAFLSSAFIERPALKLKDRVPYLREAPTRRA
ncbi:MAG: acyltransferase family protein [Rhodoglobus sp.]